MNYPVQVRMQVDISQVNKSESPAECLYAITFTLISGTVYTVPKIYNNIRIKTEPVGCFPHSK